MRRISMNGERRPAGQSDTAILARHKEPPVLRNICAYAACDMRISHDPDEKHALVARVAMAHPGTMTSVTVLGLGRMGTAMATRLQSLGWELTGWTRSGREVDSVKTTVGPVEAVENADVVILALFDGPACAQVLDRVRDSLRPGAIVVNTSTIAPAEAAALAA